MSEQHQTKIDSPFVVSNSLLNDGDALRERMDRDGYLFFRNLIDLDQIMATRIEILGRCAEAGWLQEGNDVLSGIAEPGVLWVEPQPEFMAVYNQLQRGEQFHTLAHDPNLLAMLEALFAEKPLPHPRNIARIIFPQNLQFTTPAHQDYIHVQGTEETYTAWIPIGDCPMSLGSLVVMAGSNKSGIYEVEQAYGAGGLGIDTSKLEFPWVGNDFEEGDIVLFHSLTIHKALPNASPNQIRLSVDFRYQPLSHPIDESSLLPHHAQLSWDEVYSEWAHDEYQYYWRRLPVRHASRDPRVHAVRTAARR